VNALLAQVGESRPQLPWTPPSCPWCPALPPIALSSPLKMQLALAPACRRDPQPRRWHCVHSNVHGGLRRRWWPRRERGLRSRWRLLIARCRPRPRFGLRPLPLVPLYRRGALRPALLPLQRLGAPRPLPNRAGLRRLRAPPRLDRRRRPHCRPPLLSRRAARAGPAVLARSGALGRAGPGAFFRPGPPGFGSGPAVGGTSVTAALAGAAFGPGAGAPPPGSALALGSSPGLWATARPPTPSDWASRSSPASASASLHRPRTTPPLRRPCPAPAPWWRFHWRLALRLHHW